jgi:uncharacterized phage protein (TIGR01671 family)
MREIKLRAWDKYRSEFVNPVAYVRLYNFNRDKNIAVATPDGMNITLLQYTGLKDKNDVEIYEGDVILVTDIGVGGSAPLRLRYEVYWLDSISGFALKSLDGGLTAKDKMAARQYFVSDIAKGEVIGNIYENPELMNA